MDVKAKKVFLNEALLANIPNFFSISRIILTFIVVYMIFTRMPVKLIVFIFIIAAITDFIDGKLARKFKWESEFGRRTDIIADRFLWVGTALAFIISYGIAKELNWVHGVQLLLMMSREAIGFPFAIIAFFSGNPLPQARNIAKLTTLLQGFALPAVILSVSYPAWIYLSLPISIVCCITGFISALHYIQDTKMNSEEKRK
ncbi:MAG: CDP-alcohol phosphatidyltransferase family protein [Nanoarchaeota archaeon]